MKQSRQKRIWRETRKNKLYATILLTIGVLSSMIDGDSTFTVFSAMFALPLFLAKENWIG